MDIFNIAEQYDYLIDYFDPSSGNIYKIKEYGELKGTDKELPGIRVVDYKGDTIGFAMKDDEE